MDYQTFKSWLDRYGQAWEAQNAADAQAIFDTLFTEDGTYQETPFSEPIRGRAAIIDYGMAATQAQESPRFEYKILAVTEKVGVAHWRASFFQIPTGENVELDGIFVIALDEEGRCSQLQEWWHSRHSKPD